MLDNPNFIRVVGSGWASDHKIRGGSSSLETYSDQQIPGGWVNSAVYQLVGHIEKAALIETDKPFEVGQVLQTQGGFTATVVHTTLNRGSGGDSTPIIVVIHDYASSGRDELLYYRENGTAPYMSQQYTLIPIKQISHPSSDVVFVPVSIAD